eukprot:scaffold302591_cov19-Prasinocladus_malaysianus.AAC.1
MPSSLSFIMKYIPDISTYADGGMLIQVLACSLCPLSSAVRQIVEHSVDKMPQPGKKDLLSI